MNVRARVLAPLAVMSLGIAVAGCGSTGASASVGTPPASGAPAPVASTTSTTSGQQLYQTNCALCHGQDAAGGLKLGQVTAADIRGPALASGYGNDVSLISRAILDGKDEKGGDLDAIMPHWRGKISDADVASIVAYLKTLH